MTENTTYDKVHFAVMAIEAAAEKAHLPAKIIHDRLMQQGLIHNRLFEYYDLLHTQSLEWVANDTLETLENWEMNNKEDLK